VGEVNEAEGGVVNWRQKRRGRRFTEDMFPICIGDAVMDCHRPFPRTPAAWLRNRRAKQRLVLLLAELDARLDP
jgi:uncharacterized protein YjiS (DUF1127 family)